MTQLPKISRYRSFANSFRFVKDPIGTMNDYVATYGKTFSLYVGGLQQGIVTVDPVLIQRVLQKNHRNYEKSPIHFEKLAHFLGNGLLTSTGDYWLQQRRLIQPGFHRDRLAALCEIMQDSIEQQLPHLEATQAEKGEVDAYQEMMQMAFRVVTASLFSTHIKEDQLLELSDAITTLQEFIVRQVRQPYLNPWFKLSGQVRWHEALAARTDAIILEVIRERQAAATPADDLLQMLLDARYEDTGEGMSERQLLDESKIIFVAGHETSANALAWTWYLLAQHPEVVERMLTEIDTVLGDRRPVFSDLRELTYTAQVIEESMRLYPPAWITDRVALGDDEINGIEIPAGMMAIPYIYGAHHAPDIWDEPAAFRPERFSPERRKEIPPFAYLPFGGGPRMCIGNNFAMMEMQLILVAMLRRYTLELIPGQDIRAKALITLRPYPGVRMRFLPRAR